MNLTITPLIRIAALAGLILVVAVGGAALVLGRSHSTTPAASGQRHGSFARPAKSTSPVHAKKHVTAPSAAHTKSKTAVKTATPATPAKKTVHKAVHKAATPQKTSAKHKTATHKATKTKFRGNPVYADLPAQLQWQLAHNKVVVVSFYNPNANVDAISVAEAHAGATAAKVGFLLVSVLDNKVAGILTALLPSGGLLPEPGVLIYRAPGTIALRIDGFADRDSIAQAATNALTFPAATTAAALTPATP